METELPENTNNLFYLFHFENDLSVKISLGLSEF